MLRIACQQGPIYYRDAHAALLVFDITDAASFKRVKRWVDELHAMVRLQPALPGSHVEVQHAILRRVLGMCQHWHHCHTEKQPNRSELSCQTASARLRLSCRCTPWRCLSRPEAKALGAIKVAEA